MATQKPMYATELLAGQKVKGIGKFASVGEAIVLWTQASYRGHMKVKVELSILTGERAGTNTTLTYPRTSNVLNTLELMGKTSAAKLKKERVAKHEKDTNRYYEKTAAVAKAEMKFAPGDLVQIQSTKKNGQVSSWLMKVTEIDEKNARIKGVSAEGYIGARANWASLTHPDVKVTLKEKNHFDPKADEDVKRLAANSLDAGRKRAATRARKSQLRSMFGW